MIFCQPVFVQIQQMKHQNNVRNLFKCNSKDTKTTHRMQARLKVSLEGLDFSDFITLRRGLVLTGRVSPCECVLKEGGGGGHGLPPPLSLSIGKCSSIGK